MEYRHLGRSGLMVSEIAYGNWITHGDQVEEQAAAECVRAALDEGITTFDTADAYAGGRAEEVLGRALHGVRRESLEIFTKVYWPTGDKPNDRGLSRKHVTESLYASLRRLQTDYVDLYQAHRYDHETPIEETMRAFDDLVRAGKVCYAGCSNYPAWQLALARDFIDSKRRVSEYYMYILVVLLAAVFVRSTAAQAIISPLVLVLIAVILIDASLIRRSLRKLMAERLPNESMKGLTAYAVMRALQIRRFRVPTPRVRPGDKI